MGQGLTIRLHPTICRSLVKCETLLAAGEAGRYAAYSTLRSNSPQIEIQRNYRSGDKTV